MSLSEEVADLVRYFEAFVRETIMRHDTDPRCGDDGPSDALVSKVRGHARAAAIRQGSAAGRIRLSWTLAVPPASASATSARQEDDAGYL